MKTAEVHQSYSSLMFFLGAILLLMTSEATLEAQSNIVPRFEYFTTEDGLSANSAGHIRQDHRGFLWVGSQYGLNRFDGYNFKVYQHDPDDPNSLSSNRIIYTLEDSQGDLWIPVQNAQYQGEPGVINRLNRATGKFERFVHDPEDAASISSDRATSVLEDSRKNIWVGTWNGLNRFDRATGKFERFLHDPNIKNAEQSDYIRYIYEDSDGLLWLITDVPGGLSQLDPSTGKLKQIFVDADSLSENFFTKIHEDAQKNLWLGTREQGLYKLDLNTRKLEHYGYDPTNLKSLSGNRVLDIFEDSQKELWIGTWEGGLNRLERTSGEFQRFQHDPNNPNTICHNRIRSKRIFEDPDGNLWVATNDGIALFDRKKETFQCFPYESGDLIGQPKLDNRGNIWMGSRNGLIRMYTVPASIQYYPHELQNPNSFNRPNSNVSRVFEDSDGIIWYGSWGGMDRLNRATQKFDHFNHNPKDRASISLRDVFFFMEDREGYIWAGGQTNSLDVLDRKSGKVVKSYFMVEKDSTTILVRGIVSGLEDPDGNLWFGGGKGINKLDKSTGLFQYYVPFPDAKNIWSGNYVESMIMDSEGYIWAGTWYKGLCRLDPPTGQFEYYEHEPDNPNSLSNNSVFVLYEDSKKNLWIGTHIGLNLLDRSTGKVTRYYAKHGLPDSDIKGILEDDQGRLWISTNNGISRFDPAMETFQNYDKSDGFEDNAFASFSYFKSPRSGEMFFGSTKGLHVFHPDSLRIDSFAPPPVIASFTYHNLKEERPVVDDFIAEKERITLSYLDKVLTFEFAALTFHKTTQIQYKYQLEGLSKQWYKLGNKREVTFTDLKPGNYILRVMASNGNGFWNGKPTELAIKVLSPWWWSLWTKMIYLLLLIGLIYGLYRLLLNHKLSLIEAKQLKTLDAIKSKFYTNITHEFRTPLTVIQGLSNQEIEKEGDIPAGKNLENAQVIKRNSAQLLTMVNQMLDLRKLESGSLPVNLVKGDVLQYLRYLTESFYSYAAERGIGLHFMTDLDELIIDYDADKMLHIVSNLLSNAIKFTPEGGNIYFKCDKREVGGDIAISAPEVLELHVKDTGIGISEEQLPFIFDRFYQADQNTTRQGEGSGIGLALTRELIKLLKGTVEVKSKIEQGTTFIVRFPISREATETATEQILMEDKMLGFTAPKPFKEDHSKVPINGEDIPLALIIEDNPDVIRYLGSCLDGTYKVVTAMDGQTGVNIALDSIPDIIVSDVMMPEKDGYEVCEALKNDERTSHIPIILLTAKADQASKIKGLRTGADAYLAKPFNREELQVRLEQLIEIRKKIQERYCHLQGPVEKDLRTIEDTFLEKIKKTILEHISDPEFGQMEICRALGLSRSQLFRKLKALTGKSTSLVVRSIRLEQARQLLQNTELNVSEVAYEVGFKDRAFFSRLFTEEYGEPPSSLRT